jgi:hypothetical protein
MNVTLHPHDDRWLREHARQWADEGLLTTEQVEAILRSEERRAAPGVAPAGAGRGLPLAAELLSYLGIVLVVVSGVFVVRRFWHEAGWAGRLGVALAVAAVGLIAGTLVMRLGGRSSERLGGFLWLGGTAGVALTTGVLAVELGADDGAVVAFSVGLVVMAVSAVLWRNLDRPLQFLTAVGGFGVAAGTSFDLFGLRATPLEAGGVVCGIAVALAVLGLAGVVRPQLFVMAVASIGAITGALAMSSDHRIWLALALTLAAAVVLIGLVTRLVPITVIGVIGFLQVLAAILGMYLKGTASALVILVLGITIVAIAVRIQLGRRNSG